MEQAFDTEQGRQWLTAEVRELLEAIRQPHVEKKRRTCILLAFARASQQPVKAVFGRDDTCAEQIWYGKWQYMPDVRAAFEACYARALNWADAETAALEAHYRRERRKAIGQYAAQAPAELAAVMAGPGQRGADRINAAVTLIKLADPETTGGVGVVAGGVEQSQVLNFDVSQLSDAQLDQIIAGENPFAGQGDSGTRAAPAAE